MRMTITVSAESGDEFRATLQQIGRSVEDGWLSSETAAYSYDIRANEEGETMETARQIIATAEYVGTLDGTSYYRYPSGDIYERRADGHVQHTMAGRVFEGSGLQAWIKAGKRPW